MREWVITGLTIVGGYVVISWFLHKRNHHTGFSGERSGQQTASGSQLAQQTGVGNYFVSPIASGVPTFNSDAIANGHGDQVAAAYHSNPMATLPGDAVYEPAFGPTANRGGGMEIF